MQASEFTPRDFDTVQRRGLLAGSGALALCAAGAVADPDQFLRSYLVGYLFWTGIALGSAAILMLHHLVGGGWGHVIRRSLESGMRTLPLMLVLLVPVLLGLRHLYVWAEPEAVAADELLQHKSAYLNVPFFLGRTLFYFLTWFGLVHYLGRWSAEEDGMGPDTRKGRLRKLSGPGLVLYGLTVTFASVDWVMSLEPHWFSTIYGIVFVIGQALEALALAILVVVWLARRPPMAGALRPQHSHDLGNLLLAFVMLWAYVAFSQFLIVWSGNLPEEIPWYLARFHGGWGWVPAFLVAFHFVVPFLLLLSRRNKRQFQILARLALWILIVRFVDTFWVVTPAFHPGELHVHWMDLLAPAGIGGLWVATFVWQLKRRALLPPVQSAAAEGGTG